MQRPAYPALVLTLLLAGCGTPPDAGYTGGDRSLVFNPPSEMAVFARAEELQKRGYSKEEALRKAKTEQSAQTWSYATTNDSAVRAREQRRREQAAFEKQLSELPRGY
jgi:hypothetical protein